jgi:hypothetical protein
VFVHLALSTLVINVFNVQTIKNGFHLSVAHAHLVHLILVLLVIPQLKVNAQLLLILFGQITNVYADQDLLKLDSNAFAMVHKLMTFAINVLINQIQN